ncbi:hypothetical protein AURDEDRAFT_168034 [Auricularia subglabra TFB-10046 SS5]|nr:hypothetical protein AURDEDRAFT_168034 [Auricularia subglabra TFB-10046 SS5]
MIRCVVVDELSRTVTDIIVVLDSQVDADDVVEAGHPLTPQTRRSFVYGESREGNPAAVAVVRAREFLVSYGMTPAVARHYSVLIAESKSVQQLSNVLWQLSICTLVPAGDGKDLHFMLAEKELGRLGLSL